MIWNLIITTLKLIFFTQFSVTLQIVDNPLFSKFWFRSSKRNENIIIIIFVFEYYILFLWLLKIAFIKLIFLTKSE